MDNRGRMATSPFSLLEQSLAPLLLRLQPPPWLVSEAQQRLVLLLNHVLMQEPEAQQRLRRHSGKVLRAQWTRFELVLLATPAGLLNLAAADARPDLVLAITQESPSELARELLAGKTPSVKIEGDVQLAAEIGWLAENLRWDMEEDLARVLGDAPAHSMANGARSLLQALRQWLPTMRAAPSPTVAASHQPQGSP
jgi:ubiquinone biosynthesis accessory factor UbiJ